MIKANPAHSFRTKFFYGIGSIAFGVKDNGFSALLLLFYNQALGLTVGAVRAPRRSRV